MQMAGLSSTTFALSREMLMFDTILLRSCPGTPRCHACGRRTEANYITESCSCKRIFWPPVDFPVLRRRSKILRNQWESL